MDQGRRWALITGSGRGLGVAVARTLSAAGLGVVVNARPGPSLEPARRLVEALRGEGGQAHLAEGEAGTFAGGQAVARRALELAGRVDVAVLAVGPFNQVPAPLAEATAEALEGLWRANVEGVVGALTVLLPEMRRRRFGRVLTFGMDHVEAAPGWAGHGLYAAAKVALLSLTRTLAYEEARYGITAHMIAPGFIREALKEVLTPAEGGPGRLGTGGDVARVVRFLAAEESDFLTGSVVPVGGGEVVWTPAGDLR
jgi:3-oxoacyl-[acyl-carrier protein] reductase